MRRPGEQTLASERSQANNVGALHVSEALADAVAGDISGFESLYRDTNFRLIRYARSLVQGDAEDVVSEAWLQISRDLRNFSGDLPHFRAWSATIVRHRALDHLRSSARRLTLPLELTEPAVATGSGEADPADTVIENLTTRAALALIAELPQDQAEAVLLRVVFGLDASRAGEVLGKRAGAVRVATHRGLRRLADLIEVKPDV
ncbi:MAG: polymerase, sigma-24 subunit, subfamily [Frankiales bacterium]|nr:polymerase, sigma-24 subunit, subfamily [Frankiales bacterium]